MDLSNNHKKNLYYASLILLILLSVYFAVMSFYKISNYSSSNDTYDTITVSGYGEVNAVPDIATINFTLRGEAKTVAEAQEKVSELEKLALEVLVANEIEDVDMKTINASFHPKYNYIYSSTFRSNRNVIVGYEAYETISVKVRSIDTTGKIMQELASAGVTELNGPNFEIDEQDELKAEARKKAIEDAKTKAKALAKDLGVRLDGVSSFYENDSRVYGMMYDAPMMGMAEMKSAVTSELPKGENTISSDVSVTYRIK